jgi:nitrate reductase delta subunit
VSPLSTRSRARRRAGPLADAHVRAAHACASWLIGYPDAALLDQLDGIGRLAASLDDRLAGPLGRTVAALVADDPISVCERYVETFDTRRRGCLFLTYYASGDTRRRGMALIEIRQTYLESGLEPTRDELPDHLSVVLEFSAATSLRAGMGILTRHRPGLELLRAHLETSASPWYGAVEAVCATLPAMSDAETEAMLALATDGPEAESVGLDGYGNETFDQIYPASRPGPTFGGYSGQPVAMPTRKPTAATDHDRAGGLA